MSGWSYQKTGRLIHHRVTENTEGGLSPGEGTVVIKAMFFTAEYAEKRRGNPGLG